MPRYTDQQIADALRATKGMVWVAARQLGCDGRTINARIAKSAKVREAVEEAKGMAGDVAELKLFERIQAGEGWAIQFYLKTQHKDRGYIERTETTATGEMVIKVIYDDDSSDARS